MYNVLDIDVIWMRYAIVFANCAEISGEIPVGSVLVYKGNLIGYGWNSSIRNKDPSAHAEILALRVGGRISNNYRLLGMTLYVTLEPCLMCIGAMLHARIYRLVCGARSNGVGWIIWVKNLLNYPQVNHHMFLTTYVLQKECVKQLNDFFRKRR